MPTDMNNIYLIRMVIAGICSGAIGFERENRQKPAGMRTHILVGVAASLMMIISKYGFGDVVGGYIRLDPSRMASGVVTAIGFLGSGIILTRSKSVSGINTSAGIWATVGVGVAIGAGLYSAGILATVMVILVEIFFGRIASFSSSKTTYRIDMDICGGQGRIKELKQEIANLGFKIRRLDYTQKGLLTSKASLYITVPSNQEPDQIFRLQKDWIKNLELKGRIV